MRKALLVMMAMGLILFCARGLFADAGGEERRLFLKECTAQIADELNLLSSEMTIEAHKISRVIDDRDKVRALLGDFSRRHPSIVACGLVNFEGHFETLEPDDYRKYEGVDFRSQEHIKGTFKRKKMVFSKVFPRLGGVKAAAFTCPVIPPGGKFSATLCVLVKPEILISGVVMPMVKDEPVEIWVAQEDGLVVFDQDADEIGRNIFFDNLYKPFHHLVVLNHRIRSEKRGSGSYEYYAAGTKTIVKKSAIWDTVALHGLEWRVVVTE